MPGTASASSWWTQLPVRELRRAPDVVGRVLVPGRLPGIEPRFLEGRRNSAGVHGPVTAGQGERSAGTAVGQPYPGRLRPRIRGEKSERTAARTLLRLPAGFLYSRLEFDCVRTGNPQLERA